MRKNSKNNSQKNIEKAVIIIICALAVALVQYLVPSENKNIINTITQNTTIKTSNEVNKNIGINDIPEYSGQIVISINNDVTYFEEQDITTENFENYSILDDLNRAGVAFANICKLTMPPEGVKRGNISYKPTGWEQYMYGENNKEHLYERCHLIAWQLGNENNNKNNLLTGTSSLNSAMIEYENKIANWIKQKNKEGKDYHILYRVTPIYDGDNLLATGVELEAKSVEEEGVEFNKFIYNVQDGFELDYSTGKAKLIK